MKLTTVMITWPYPIMASRENKWCYSKFKTK